MRSNVLSGCDRADRNSDHRRRRRLVGRAAAAGQRARDLRRHRRATAASTASARPHPRSRRSSSIEQLPAPVVVGFDFSFGFPAWFARRARLRDRSTTSGRSPLATARRWLAPTPPFWRDALRRAGRTSLPDVRASRCAPAKSIFQLVGNGQVGAGSVRGHAAARAAPRRAASRSGRSTRPGERTVVEIYPAALRRLRADDHERGRSRHDHERDAVESARVMWEHRESFAALARRDRSRRPASKATSGCPPH